MPIKKGVVSCGKADFADKICTKLYWSIPDQTARWKRGLSIETMKHTCRLYDPSSLVQKKHEHHSSAFNIERLLYETMDMEIT